MKSFFDPGVEAIFKAINKQREAGSSRGEIGVRAAYRSPQSLY